MGNPKEEVNNPKSICQSCAAALEIRGTEADGTKSEDYCSDCYQEGEFTELEVTMQEMIERIVVETAESKDLTFGEAQEYLESIFPTLKRWATEI